MATEKLNDAAKECGAGKALVDAVKTASGLKHSDAVRAINEYANNGHAPGTEIDPEKVLAHLAHGSPSEGVETSGRDDALGAEPEDIFAQATRARKERKRTGTKPKITRKPMPIPVVTKTKAWFRAHPDGAYTEVPIFIDPTSEEMETKPYYVTPDLADELEGSDGLTYQTGYLICTANGKVMLFLVREADLEGNMHAATEAKHEACADAQEHWTRMTWEKDVGQYQISHAEWDKKEPRWPADITEETVFRLAFGKQVLDDWDHPILKNFRGED